MPNYVFNNMTISGPTDEVLRFKKECYDERGLSFNKLIPMPESLNVVSGGNNDDALLMYLTDNGKKRFTLDLKKKFCEMVPYTAILTNGDVKKFNFPITVAKAKKAAFNEDGSPKLISIKSSGFGDKENPPTHTFYEFGKILSDNFEKYGATEWYEWSCQNWGTKWDTCEFCESSCTEEDDRTVLDISFSTAWAPPTPVFRCMAKKFPELEFSCICEEEQGFGCEFIIENNEFRLEDVTPWNDDDSDYEWLREEDMTEEEFQKAVEESKEALGSDGFRMALEIASGFGDPYDKVFIHGEEVDLNQILANE